MKIEDLIDLSDQSNNLLITAIDKNYHHLLDKLVDVHPTIVIHDPTEIKSNQGNLVKYLSQMNVITIRKTVSEYLNNIGINNQCLLHPYVSHNLSPLPNKQGAVSISRIDYDKHTDIILKANQLLPIPIDIYGDKNDRYIYHKLKTYDCFDSQDDNSAYQGRFPKSVQKLAEILQNKTFLVDLSKIKNDGGGTQYTFLEALDYGCVLVLNKAWTNVPNSIWRPTVNCLAIQNEQELVKILENPGNLDKILENSKLILTKHLETTDWDWLNDT